MLKNVIALTFSVLLFTSCSKPQEKPLVISTDIWIGAAPLYYAHAMGWLGENNIQMLQVDTIDKNLEMYDSKASDIFTGTEHEYHRAKMKHPELIVPIIHDRSYGGDVILSNQSQETLRQSHQKIEVYVELNTVGEDMLEYFIADNKISKDRLIIHDRHQPEISQIRNTPASGPIILITYNPLDLELKKYGFSEIASSKNDAYLVVDTFITSAKTYKEHEEQLRSLNESLKRSVDAYNKDPKGFYTKVKPYLEDPTYEEFETMRKNVQWLNNTISTELLARMEKAKLPTKDLIR